MDAHADLARTYMHYDCKSPGEYSWLVENIRDGKFKMLKDKPLKNKGASSAAAYSDTEEVDEDTLPF